MHSLLVRVWVVAAALTGLAASGCSAPGSPPPTVAQPSAQPAPRLYPFDARAAVAPELTLFGDDPELERVPFQSRLVANLQQHTFTTEGLDFDPDVTRDGSLLVFASTRNAEHPDIYLKKPNGTALTQLTGDPADDIQPRFSPDGQRVAFCSNRSGNWDIWVVQRDGTGLTQLTRDRADEMAPAWSPDGTQIAYTLWGYRSHQWEIWTLEVDRPGVRRFLAYGMFPAWSPDGRRVAFQRARQRGSRWFSIWTVELVDGEARHPTEVARSETAACITPCWTPDGSAIVYCAVRPDRESEPIAMAGPEADLWIVDLSSGLTMKLTDGSATAFNPTCGRDGRIYFVSARAGTENIWSLDARIEMRQEARQAWGGSSASAEEGLVQGE